MRKPRLGIAAALVVLALLGTAPSGRQVAHASGAAATRSKPKLLLLRDAHESFAKIEAELRKRFAGPLSDRIVLGARRPSKREQQRVLDACASLARADVVVAAGRRAVTVLAQINARSCRAKRATIASAGMASLAHERGFDWFLPIHAPVDQRLEQLLGKLPEVARVGVLLPPPSERTLACERAVRAIEKLAGRSLVEFRHVSAAHEAIRSVAHFGEDVEALILMPDRRTVPSPGSRLELEFLKAVVKRELWLVTFDHRQLPSRSVLSIEPDFGALARCVAGAVRGPRPRRHRVLRCAELHLRASPSNLRSLRESRRR